MKQRLKLWKIWAVKMKKITECGTLARLVITLNVVLLTNFSFISSYFSCKAG